MRQHLANAIFRAVENDRDVLRVTNSGISAFIDSSGRVIDSTRGFEPTVRNWTAGKEHEGTTFYTRHGDVFAYLCALISLGFVGASFIIRKNLSNRRG
jgi:apolipoprotein N-acyltransferase